MARTGDAEIRPLGSPSRDIARTSVGVTSGSPSGKRRGFASRSPSSVVASAWSYSASRSSSLRTPSGERHEFDRTAGSGAGKASTIVEADGRAREDAGTHDE